MFINDETYHIYPKRPILECDVHKIERHRDSGQYEVCDGEVGDQHVPGGKKDLEYETWIWNETSLFNICKNCTLFVQKAAKMVTLAQVPNKITTV